LANLAQLYEALKNADAAGATDDARMIADEIVKRKAAFKPAQGPGIGANAVAATKDLAYGIAGAPVDLATAAINTATQPNKSLSGVPIIGSILDMTQNLSQMASVPAVPDNAPGSSRWLAEQGEKIGITDPAKVEAVTIPEKMVRSGVEAIGYTMAPELLLAKLKSLGIVGKQAVEMAESIIGGNKSAAGLLRNAATGGAGGAGATLGMEVAPEPLKPLAAVLGALVGGVGTDLVGQGVVRTARGAAKKTGEFFDPMRGDAGIERAAGRRVAAGLDATPEEAIATIDAAPAPISGARPTLAQATGDRGAATMERAASRADPVKFEERAAEQEAAHVDFLRRVQRTGGAEDMAPAITRHTERVDELVAAHNDRVHELLTKIDDVAQRRTQAIAEDMSTGRRDPVNAGEEMRGLLGVEREARRKVEGALHEAIDPDGTLVTKTNSLRDTYKRMNTRRAALAKPITGEEKDIIDAVGALEPTASYMELAALKTRIGDEMRLEAREKGKTAKWGRLSQYAKAVANDLRAPAVARAKEEAAAVKAGTLAPEDTFVAKIRTINDELDRNAASFGTLDDGTGALSAGPPPTGPRNPGAAGQGGNGFSYATSGAAVPGQDGGGIGSREAMDLLGGPEAVVDPDVAARLAAADAATIDRVNTFDNKTLKPILARPSAANPFTMPASEVPKKIFQKGPAGGETMTQYRAAVGDVQALPVIEGYAIDDMARFAMREDGTLDPKKVATWRSNHAEALRSFPALDARLANATTAIETAGAVAKARRAKVTKAQKSIASKLAATADPWKLGGATEPGEITTIVGKIFDRADSVKQMQQLRRALKGDKDANAGLRKAIVDHIMAKAVKDATGLGDETLSATRLRDFLDENEATLVAAGFTNPEIQSMKALADEAARAAVVAKSARPEEGGAQAAVQNILKFGTGPNATPASLFLRMAVQSAGHSVVPFLFGGPLVGLASLIGAGAVNAMRAKGLQSVDELFREALLDPALARKLLAKVNARNLKPVVNSFRQQLTRSTLGGSMAGFDKGEEVSGMMKPLGRAANAGSAILLDQFISAQPTGGPEDEVRVASIG